MQQTETLRLNLIEGSDTVDPAPINENMETLETETQAIREEMTSANTALTASLTSLAAEVGSGGKTCRIAYGTYVGTGTYGSSAPQVFEFDFNPVLFYVTRNVGGGDCHILRPATGISGGEESDTLTVTWGDKSVSFYSTVSGTRQFNFNGNIYCYFAIGVAE